MFGRAEETRHVQSEERDGSRAAERWVGRALPGVNCIWFYYDYEIGLRNL